MIMSRLLRPFVPMVLTRSELDRLYGCMAVCVLRGPLVGGSPEREGVPAPHVREHTPTGRIECSDTVGNRHGRFMPFAEPQFCDALAGEGLRHSDCAGIIGSRERRDSI
jgi:hypothetical protein